MAYLTIVINSNSSSITQLNQNSSGPTNVKNELNKLIDYLARCAGGFEVVQAMYVTTRNTDPAVTTDGGSSMQFVYNPPQ
jgi:hypothetical protein